MSVQLAGRLSALLFCFLICVGCGDVYRPTIIPQPVQPPDPKNAHAAFTVNQNGAFNPGTGLQVDVSGDSAAGVTKVANLPVHAVVQGGRVWVVNRGSNSVSAFTVASGSTVPIGTAIAINLPSSPIVVPPGSPTNDIVASPNFVYTTETATVYVASAFVHSQNPNLNDLNGTVTVINSITNTISNAVAVGMYPIAMTETPTNTATTGLVKQLYVVNRDSNNITVVQEADQPVLTTLGREPRRRRARLRAQQRRNHHQHRQPLSRGHGNRQRFHRSRRGLLLLRQPHQPPLHPQSHQQHGHHPRRQPGLAARPGHHQPHRRHPLRNRRTLPRHRVLARFRDRLARWLARLRRQLLHRFDVRQLPADRVPAGTGHGH